MRAMISRQIRSASARLPARWCATAPRKASSIVRGTAPACAFTAASCAMNSILRCRSHIYNRRAELGRSASSRARAWASLAGIGRRRHPMRLVCTFHRDLCSVQQPFDAAVVIPTVLRPTLKAAVQSIFRQSFPGRLQILIGIDRAIGDPRILDEILAERPERHAVTLLDPGYSTSMRNGGVHLDGLGGTMRAILSYMANSRYVAYLDDDNWFADETSRRPVGIDTFESVGPGQGVYTAGLGGWVDPNCLMIDKVNCEPVLRCWSAQFPFRGTNWSSDRSVFDALRHRRWISTGEPSVFYAMHTHDRNHAERMKYLRENAAARKPPAAGDGSARPG